MSFMNIGHNFELYSIIRPTRLKTVFGARKKRHKPSCYHSVSFLPETEAERNWKRN